MRVLLLRTIAEIARSEISARGLAPACRPPLTLPVNRPKMRHRIFLILSFPVPFLTCQGVVMAICKSRAVAMSLLACAAIVLLMPDPTAAQIGSGISGVVRDTSGAVLPGVTVEAASRVLIEGSRTTVTDSGGQYQIIDLRPGEYTVTFTLPGLPDRQARRHHPLGRIHRHDQRGAAGRVSSRSRSPSPARRRSSTSATRCRSR